MTFGEVETLLRKLVDRRDAVIDAHIGHTVAVNLTGAEIDLIVIAINELRDSADPDWNAADAAGANGTY